MIEITHRWGLAKRGKWSFEGEEIQVPNVLFLSGEEFDPPSGAEVTVSTEEGSSFKVPSSFFENSDEDHIFPAAFAYPGGLDESKVESKGGHEDVQVIHDQEPDPEVELYILGNAPILLNRSEKLYEEVIELRKKIDYHKLIYVPGIAQPQNMALLTYLGVDLFDSSFLELMVSHGVELSDWMGFSGDDENSQDALLSELFLIRKGIEKGRIRELVESRVRSEPWLVEVLRKCDEDHSVFSKGVSMTNDELYATTRESLERPDIKRYRKRLETRYAPPKRDVLLLLPCSAKKPYFQSRTHRRIREATQKVDWTNIHEVILTSPLGAVPRELELFYPAQQYDIPVSKEWFEREKEIILQQVETLLDKQKYVEIISHLPPDMKFVSENIDCVNTTDGKHPTSSIALEELTSCLKEYVGKNLGSSQSYLQENLTSFARFQFGPGGGSLLRDAKVKGRYPWYKIMSGDGEDQRGMLVPERGLISLTLEGAEILKEEDIYQAEIEDFESKGSIFAVGVKDASKKIRPEDEVIVVHDDELRGVGPASMSGEEMVEAEKGEAIRLRHYP